MDSEQPQRLRSIPSAAGGIARLACARLREHGKDIVPLLTKAGLTLEEANDPAIRLEVRAQIRFLDLAAEALEDDLLGFHLARSFDLREIGLLYYVIASSEQLEEALQNAVRFGRITNEGVHLQVEIDQALMIALEYMNVDRLSDKHQAEFLLIALVRLCRQVTDTRLAPVVLKARHFRDRTPAEIRKFLGCDVEFSSDVDEIVFPKQIAALPLTGRDPYLNTILRRYAEEALENQTFSRESIRAEVEKVLTELLPHGGRNGSCAQARHESADTLAKTARSGRNLRRDTGPLPGRSRQALLDGEGIAGLRSRLAARLQRTQLFHPRLQTLDGVDAPAISIVPGGVNNGAAK